MSLICPQSDVTWTLQTCVLLNKKLKVFLLILGLWFRAAKVISPACSGSSSSSAGQIPEPLQLFPFSVQEKELKSKFIKTHDQPSPSLLHERLGPVQLTLTYPLND